MLLARGSYIEGLPFFNYMLIMMHIGLTSQSLKIHYSFHNSLGWFNHLMKIEKTNNYL